MRPAIALLLAAAACAKAAPIAGVGGPDGVDPADLAWTIDTLGPVMGMSLVTGGDTLLFRFDDEWPSPGQSAVVERRTATGDLAWRTQVAGALSLEAAASAGESFVAIGHGNPNSVVPTTSELSKIATDGTVLWTVTSDVAYGFLSLQPDGAGGVVAATNATATGPRFRWFAADGTVTRDEPRPTGFVSFALDGSGGMYLLTEPSSGVYRLDRRDAGGATIWTRSIPTSCWKLEALAAATIALSCSFNDDFTWGNRKVVFQPDPSTGNPEDCALVADRDGTPLVAIDGAGGARIVISAAGGEIAWIRSDAYSYLTPPCDSAVHAFAIGVSALDGSTAWERTFESTGCFLPGLTTVAAAPDRVALGGYQFGGLHVLIGGADLWRGRGFAAEVRR